MEFDREKWLASYGEFYVEGNTRYRMMLWLGDNYEFCGKPLDEILDTFIGMDSDSFGRERYREWIVENKQLTLETKHHDPNFIIGIDLWILTGWIDLYLDDDLRVSKAVAVYRKPHGEPRAEKKIWQQPIYSQR